MPRTRIVALVTTLALVATPLGSAHAAPTGGGLPDLTTGPAPLIGDPTATSWMVVFKDGATPVDVDTARLTATLFGGSVGASWDAALLGFAFEGGPSVVKALRSLDGVAHVESDDAVTAAVVETTPDWGLDRIDQRDLPLDGTFEADTDGAGTTLYVLDTGIRASHITFGGRVATGFSAITDGDGTHDCHGHGTHVASLAAGVRWGVAPGAAVVPVRVLDCSGSGHESDLVTGLDHVAAAASTPAVANLSVSAAVSATVDAAAQGLVDRGVVVVAAAGNQRNDACNHSPSRLADVITVGASTADDSRADFSNTGPCIDLFAPGHDVTGADIDGDEDVATRSGTSMAAPLVAGVAALALATDPGRTPRQVAELLLETATPGRLTATMGAPNLLLAAGRTVSDLPGGPNPLPADPAGCDGHDTVVTGDLDEGAVALVPADLTYDTDGHAEHAGCLDGPAGVDFDLTLLRRDPATGDFEVVARATTPAPDEALVATAPAGQYAWAVRAVAGDGTFRVGWTVDTAVAPAAVPPPCDLDEAVTGELTGPGDTAAATPSFVLAPGDRTRGCLGGPEGADLDLVLQRRRSDGSWRTAEGATTTAVTEDLDHVADVDGTYRWLVRSVEGGGTWSLSWSSSPTTRLRSTTVDGTSATVRFGSDDPDATFLCRLDDGPTWPCTSPRSFTRLPAGAHRVRVTAVDVHGTADPSPAVTEFRIEGGTTPTRDAPGPAPSPTPQPAPAPLDLERFDDVAAADPFAPSIARLAAAGVTKGCNPPANTSFCPDAPVTRGAMAAFLVRALDLPAAGGDRFSDDDGSVFARDIEALAAAGVTKGCNPPANTSFCPDAPVTRAQMAAFLDRAGLLG